MISVLFLKLIATLSGLTIADSHIFATALLCLSSKRTILSAAKAKRQQNRFRTCVLSAIYCLVSKMCESAIANSDKDKIKTLQVFAAVFCLFNQKLFIGLP